MLSCENKVVNAYNNKYYTCARKRVNTYTNQATDVSVYSQGDLECAPKTVTWLANIPILYFYLNRTYWFERVIDLRYWQTVSLEAAR